MKLRRRRRRTPEPSPGLPTGVAVVQIGGVELWAVEGELDIATKDRLGAVLDAVPGSEGPLAVDLTDVTFIDSTGLSLLLRIDGAARDAGRRLAIVCPEGPARLLLAVSGVEDELPLHLTREAALAALA